MVIRRIEDRDLEICAKMLETVELFQDYGLSGPGARKSVGEAFTSPGSDVWVAEIAGTVVGFAWFASRGGFARSAYLKLICVTPSAQGKGVGEALIRHFESLPEFRRGLLLLCTSSNTRAAAFYEGLGYQRVGVLPQFASAGHDEIIFWKPGTRNPDTKAR